MALLTLVEEYVTAAMKHAISEQLEDGTVGATIPGCPGVIAFGADNHECATVLYARLEDWIKVNLLAGNELPIIDCVDLNRDADRILATYHNGVATQSSAEFYTDEDELEAIFDKRSDNN